MEIDFSKYTILLDRRCPHCGEPLRASRQGYGEFKAVCLNTHCPKWYRAPDGPVKSYYYELNTGAKEGQDSPDFGQLARKQEAFGYYTAMSVFSDDRFSRKDLHNFNNDTTEQANAFHQAKLIANSLAASKPAHALLFGVSGAGKSHLANGILLSAMKLSDYRLHGLFLDWREFIEIRKRGIGVGNDDLRKRADKVQAQFSKADIIVLDDLGSERSTDFTADLVDDIIRKRTEKPLIITSNLNAGQLRDKYDDRTMRRFLMSQPSFSFQFNHSAALQQVAN